MSAALSQLVLRWEERPDLADAMRAFYERVDAAIAARHPVCQNRGACCKFEAFGHKLYVTTPELAYFAGGRRSDWRPVAGGATCPYQVEGQCTAREHRPLGCRVFFCDPAAQDWQPDAYEAHLAELRAMCDAEGIEYRNVEWLSALRELDAAGGLGAPPRD